MRAAAQLLRGVFHPTMAGDRTVPPTTEILAGIAGRVAKLEARDAHACPPNPTGCGCVRGLIRAHVEDAERAASQVPGNLAWLIDALEKLDAALTIRVDAFDPTVHRAPPMAGVSVVTPTGDPAPEPAPPGPRVLREFNPLS